MTAAATRRASAGTRLTTALACVLLTALAAGCSQGRGAAGQAGSVLIDSRAGVLSLALHDGASEQLWPWSTPTDHQPHGVWVHDWKRDCYYALSKQGTSVLRLRPRQRTADEVLQAPSGGPAFSRLLAITADADALVLFVNPSRLYRWEINGGPPSLLCDTGDLGEPGWVRAITDDENLYLGYVGRITLLRPDGTVAPLPQSFKRGLYAVHHDGTLKWLGGERLRDVSPSGRLLLEATPSGYAVRRLDGAAPAKQPKLKRVNKALMDDDRIARGSEGMTIEVVNGRQVTRTVSGARVPDGFRGNYMRTEPVFVSEHELAYVRECPPYTMALTLPHYGLFICDLNTGRERRVFKGSPRMMFRGSHGRVVPWYLFDELLGRGR